MLNAKKWNLIFKISCCILIGVLVSFIFVGSNILDLLHIVMYLVNIMIILKKLLKNVKKKMLLRL